MYSKIDETEMTPTSFSMNTILTNEKQKISENELPHDHKEDQNNNEENKNIEDELPKKEELSQEAKHVHVNLEESDLWKKFKTLTNEMIVTKNGR